MTLEEFAESLRQDVLAGGADSLNLEVDVFTEEVIEAMTEAGDADGFILCNRDERGYKINAYNISSDGDCVDLFVTAYTRKLPPERVPTADVDRHFKRLRGFFQRALTDDFRAGLEEASPEFDAADSIHAARSNVTRGRLFFITDGRTAVREYDDVLLDGIKFSHHIWDIERIFKMRLPELLGRPSMCDLKTSEVQYCAFAQAIHHMNTQHIWAFSLLACSLISTKSMELGYLKEMCGRFFRHVERLTRQFETQS